MLNLFDCIEKRFKTAFDLLWNPLSLWGWGNFWKWFGTMMHKKLVLRSFAIIRSDLCINCLGKALESCVDELMYGSEGGNVGVVVDVGRCLMWSLGGGEWVQWAEVEVEVGVEIGFVVGVQETGEWDLNEFLTVMLLLEGSHVVPSGLSFLCLDPFFFTINRFILDPKAVTTFWNSISPYASLLCNRAGNLATILCL